MKKTLLLIFFATNTYCQDISYIKSLDTIFVNFKEDIVQNKSVFPIDKVGFEKRWYTITLGNDYNRNLTRFYFQEYLTPVKREKKIKSDVKLVKKSFFKKHKKQIVGIDFFKNNDACTLRDIFFNKVVYIIDTVEKKRGKTTLYEVNPSFSCDPIE